MRRKLVYAEEVLDIVRPYLEDGDDYVENTAQEIIEAVEHLPDAEAIPVSVLMVYAEEVGLYQPLLCMLKAWQRYKCRE